ncbi:hypothetical protein CW304_30950 [Bacillus sp. UFRGS-B20]|nr:hypothetical protein CW304_30950 [Bacillus sp. UFRGS-B20]
MTRGITLTEPYSIMRLPLLNKFPVVIATSISFTFPWSSLPLINFYFYIWKLLKMFYTIYSKHIKS